MILAAVGAALLSLSACGDKCPGGACKADKPDQTFTGVVPSADGPGIRYTLKLDYDDDHANMEGDYDLVETYLEADTTNVNGIRDNISYRSEGDFSIVEQGGKKYIKLVKDAKDSNPQAVATLNFEVASDSTLVMVDDALQPAINPAMYTLSLVR